MNKLSEQRIIERKHYLALLMMDLATLNLPISYTNIGRYDFLNRNKQVITRAKLLDVPGNRAESARQKFIHFRSEIQELKDARRSMNTTQIPDILEKFGLEEIYKNVDGRHCLIFHEDNIDSSASQNERLMFRKLRIGQFHYPIFNKNRSSEI